MLQKVHHQLIGFKVIHTCKIQTGTQSLGALTHFKPEYEPSKGRTFTLECLLVIAGRHVQEGQTIWLAAFQALFHESEQNTLVLVLEGILAQSH